jgi:type I pantothenate kinase
MTPADSAKAECNPELSVELGFDVFSRARWASLTRQSGSTLSDPEARRLVATGEPIALDELADIYLPLSQLLSLMAEMQRQTRRQIDAFLGQDRDPVPFIIGIAGGVAVGKSTTARVLQALLRQTDGAPSVDLLTTDGFLYPNATLVERGIMSRKGFPESYDQRHLIDVLAAIRSGTTGVRAPLYSHLTYDIVPDEFQVVERPDIIIVEGLNVLQVNTRGAAPDQVVVSDFFDFSIYVDAREEDVARWFRERLLALSRTVLREPASFFHRFASLSDDEISTLAQQVWDEINAVNLRENIEPTRSRADLVLEKDDAHLVHRLLLRRS